ncbi:ribonuclease G [Lachnospiraceae bacterium NSJ-12]|uniref:Ribonuclease G n=1 Tax=Zhenhengia yiwuensis TaxID=2763666 RepID=A0A926IF78_9FIRM|nr:ribonuclease G [Zhenhengia yiwuensis]
MTLVPSEVKKWNWGAFTFNIFWGIGNKTYLPLLCLIPYFNLIWIFVCGFKGNEWAWKSGNYSVNDIEKFLMIQNTWNRGGLAKFIIGLIGTILIFILYGMLFAYLMGFYYY